MRCRRGERWGVGLAVSSQACTSTVVVVVVRFDTLFNGTVVAVSCYVISCVSRVEMNEPGTF